MNIEFDKIINNLDFINSSEGRSIRILSEYLETKSKLEQHNIKNIIVHFGSARILPMDVAKANLEKAKLENKDLIYYKNQVEISQYYELSKQLAYKFALWGKNLPIHKKCYVSSGGGGGIMEATNLGAFEAGEKSLGFNIILPFEQEANSYITKELIFNFNYFFLRKFWFSYLAKGFVVFPGGFGTMDEMFENLTLLQTHKMRKKIPIVLFGSEFFNSFLNFDILIKYGLIQKSDIDLFITTDSIDEAFNHIVNNIELYEDKI